MGKSNLYSKAKGRHRERMIEDGAYDGRFKTKVVKKKDKYKEWKKFED